MKRKKKQVNTLRLAIIFCSSVLVLIVISLVFKTLVLIKDSNFDGTNRFNVEILQDNKVSVVSFSPLTHSITILNLKGKPANSNLSQYLELPIDGVIETKDISLDKKNLTSNLSKFLFNFNDKKTNLTIIDVLRLFLYARDVSLNSIYQRDVDNGDSLTINSFISSFFIDSAIANEKITIEVVNATQVYGLANRLASYITNIGGDVVLVSTSDKLENNSQIYYSNDLSYTVKRLSKVLGIKYTKSPKRDISDVTIIIGKDILQKLKF